MAHFQLFACVALAKPRLLQAKDRDLHLYAGLMGEHVNLGVRDYQEHEIVKQTILIT